VIIGTAATAASIAAASAASQTAAAGTAVAIPPSVIVKDEFNNPKSGVGVSFKVESGGGILTGATATTNASGIATVGSWTLGPNSVENRLSATSGSLIGSPVFFTATPTSVGFVGTMSALSALSQSATVGTAVAAAPSVSVRNAAGDPVSGVNITFTLGTTGGSVVPGNGVVPTNANGIATVGSWTLGTLAGPYKLTAAAANVAGTQEFTATGTAGAATQIAVNDGNAQPNVPAGSAVPIPPSVIVKDAFGNRAGGVAVTFAVATGGGSLTGAAATTNSSGVATVGSWTLGPSVGANTLTATSAGLTGSPVTFAITSVPGSGTIAKSGGDNQSATNGTAVAVAPSVIVKDNNNNPIAGVNVTFAVTAGGGSLTGAAAVTNASGIATVGSWTLGAVAGVSNNALTATSAGAIGSSVTFTASATAGTAASIAKNAGDLQTNVPVPTDVPVPPSVIVKDGSGNPVSGVAVTFAVAIGGGSVTGGAATTNASGIATVGSWKVGPTPGSNTLTATSAGLTGSPLTFTATSIPGIGTMTITPPGTSNNQSATVATTVAIDPSVTIKDDLGNAVSGRTVTFAVATGGGSVTLGTATTNGSGVATVGSWTLGNIAGANTLTATSVGATGSPLTFAATGTAGNATQIAANAGTGQTGIVAGAAVPIPPSVIVKDIFGNVKSGVSVTFAVTGGGGSGGLSTTTVASGIATVGSWTLGTTVGLNTMTATSGTLSGSPVTFTTTSVPGTPIISVNAGNNQSATVNTNVAVAPSVLVKDANNNLYVGASVTFAVATGGGSVVGGTTTTNASGIAPLGSWKLGTSSAGGAGNNTLTVSTAGAAPLTFTATANADVPNGMTLNGGNGQTAPAGTVLPVDPSVLIRDQFLNPVSGVGVTFAVATGGGSGTGLGATTNASGVATVGSWTLGPTAGSNTMTANSAAVAGVTITFTATGSAATPGAPTITTITPGDASLSVAFTAPASDGGATITNYEYSTNNGGSWTAVSPASATSPVSIAGLTNGTTYQVRLRAVNSAGSGTQSSAQAGTPRTVPDAPTITSIVPGSTGGGKTSLSVAFTAGFNGGSAITNYQYSTDGGGSWTAVSPADTTSPLVISGLTAGTTYAVQIRAVNVVGVGAASGSVNRTTNP
jgi:adhesin/invasin